jgi:AraC family transcriptional regulator
MAKPDDGDLQSLVAFGKSRHFATWRVMNHPPVPDLTSAESLASYPPGQMLLESLGPAWNDIQMSVFSLSAEEEAFDMPAVSEPFIAWVVAGEARTDERELGGSWVTSHIRPGSLFLTMAGAPYTFRWKRLSAEPLEVVLLLLSMPIFEMALEELYGEKARESQDAHFRNMSGIEDAKLVSLLQCLRGELSEHQASALFVRGIANAIAVHLARHYVDIGASQLPEASALPSYKVRVVTLWMSEHLAEPFSLAALAEIAGMSESHFNRLFKKATGMPPSQYHIKLRMETARRLLRETATSVVAIANDVGYSNPSHFAQLFRKETGLTPSDYRRQR